jgi:hypothetical protein
MSKNGLILLTPTSIVTSGSSTITANGSVSVVNDQYLTLNGVFSADYDNYMLVIQMKSDNLVGYIGCRLASGGTWAGTDYTQQYLETDNTTVFGYRATSYNSIDSGYIQNALTSGSITWLYGPYLAQPTAARSTWASTRDSARTTDVATTHSLSTSYDGLGFYNGVTTFSGRIAVYGMRK